MSNKELIYAWKLTIFENTPLVQETIAALEATGRTRNRAASMSNKSQLKRVVTQSPEFAYLKITELETQLAERDAEIAALNAQVAAYGIEIDDAPQATDRNIEFPKK